MAGVFHDAADDDSGGFFFGRAVGLGELHWVPGSFVAVVTGVHIAGVLHDLAALAVVVSGFGADGDFSGAGHFAVFAEGSLECLVGGALGDGFGFAQSGDEFAKVFAGLLDGFLVVLRLQGSAVSSMVQSLNSAKSRSAQMA